MKQPNEIYHRMTDEDDDIDSTYIVMAISAVVCILGAVAVSLCVLVPF